MHPLIENNRAAIESLCREFGVARLEVFGSVVSGEFDPEQSDVDFIVEYPEGYNFDIWLSRYFELKVRLEGHEPAPIANLVILSGGSAPWCRIEAVHSRHSELAEESFLPTIPVNETKLSRHDAFRGARFIGPEGQCMQEWVDTTRRTEDEEEPLVCGAFPSYSLSAPARAILTGGNPTISNVAEASPIPAASNSRKISRLIASFRSRTPRSSVRKRSESSSQLSVNR